MSDLEGRTRRWTPRIRTAVVAAALLVAPLGSSGEEGAAREGASAPAQAEQVPFPHAPVPAAERAQVAEAARRLKQRVERVRGGGAGGTRAACFLDKLAAGGDGRIIEWTRICPSITGGADSEICTFTAVNEEDLEKKIRRVEDVESANGELHFFSFLDAYALRLDRNFPTEEDDFRVVEDLQRIDDEMAAARDELARIASDTSEGEPPAYYRALHEWIARQQADAGSVYSCMAAG